VIYDELWRIGDGFMSDETTESDPNGMEWAIDLELSERELLSIGKIVALWGTLEHEIFCQTLRCLSPIACSQIPKEMNNMKFSKVLTLWETHVVNNAVGKRKEVLREQLENIRHYYDFRNALAHGMWDWSHAAPEKLIATRIRKKEMVRTHFTADDLASFASVLGTINFKVRYPNGLEGYAAAMAEQGSYMSRRAVCLVTGDPLTDDLFSTFPLKSGDKV
jgi:hypothetical protein